MPCDKDHTVGCNCMGDTSALPGVTENWAHVARMIFTAAEMVELYNAIGSVTTSVNDVRATLGLSTFESPQAQDGSELREALEYDPEAYITHDEWEDDWWLNRPHPGGFLNPAPEQREYMAGIINPDGTREYIDVTTCIQPLEARRWIIPPNAPVAAMDTLRDDLKYGKAARDDAGQPVAPVRSQPTPADKHQAGGDPAGIKQRMRELGLWKDATSEPPPPEKPPTYLDIDVHSTDPELARACLSVHVYWAHEPERKIPAVLAYDTLKGWVEVIDDPATRAAGVKKRKRLHGPVCVRWAHVVPANGALPVKEWGAAAGSQLERDVANLERDATRNNRLKFKTCVRCDSRPVPLGSVCLCDTCLAQHGGVNTSENARLSDAGHEYRRRNP